MTTYSKNRKFLFMLLIIMIALTWLSSGTDIITKLDADLFSQLVVPEGKHHVIDNQTWFIMFHASWCGHC